jgi:hypothetical protein
MITLFGFEGLPFQSKILMLCKKKKDAFLSFGQKNKQRKQNFIYHLGKQFFAYSRKI